MRLSALPLLALLGTSAAAEAQVFTPWPPVITLTPQARVDNAVNAFKATRKFKGAVVVVIDHGVPRYYFYGSRDASGNAFTSSTPISIASITKTFTGTALAVYDKFSALDRKAKLSSFVTTINSSSPPYNATLEDLADHRSGLPRDLPGTINPTTKSQLYQTLNQCASWSSPNEPCIAPGGSEYSNYAYMVLGNVLADYGGYATWNDLNEWLITDTLSLTKTCPRGEGCFGSTFSSTRVHPFAFDGTELSLIDHDPITDPGGGLWSTAVDMAKWMQYNLGELAVTSNWNSYLLNGVLAELRAPLNGAVGYSWKFSSLAFDNGTSSTIRWKSGRYAGLDSWMGLADDRDVGVFVFVNRDPVDPNGTEDNGEVLRTELGQEILSAFP